MSKTGVYASTTATESPTIVKTKLRIYTAIDVARHTTKKDCWITRNGKVYNVSEFVNDHPGGDDLILQYAGKDIGDVMADSAEHEHSQSAYDMLGEYLVGKLGAVTTIVDESELHRTSRWLRVYLMTST